MSAIYKKFDVFVLSAIAILCYSATPLWFQNDTFYSIMVGERIAEQGIDMTDGFSWHDLPYCSPHWAFDVIVYWIYNTGGLWGVYIYTVMLCLLLGLTVYALNRRFSCNRAVAFFVTAVVLFVLYNGFITARAQMMSYIFLLIAVYFIEKFLASKRIIFCAGLFIVAVLIANVHAAVFPFFFVLFIPYITEFIIATLKPKNTGRLLIVRDNGVKWLSLVAVVCLFAGLLTPTGDTPYTYLFKTIAGMSMVNITEHRPLILILSIGTMLVAGLFLFFIILTSIRIRLKDLLMVGGLFIMTLAGNRHLSLFAIIGMFFWGKLASDYLKEKQPELTDRFIDVVLKRKGVIITIICVIFFSALMRSGFGMRIYDRKFHTGFYFLTKPTIDEVSYPVKACNYITDSLDVKNIRLFNEYNYGSYLMFRHIPVFVDSRADLYTIEFNGKRNILQDFFDISRIKKFYDEAFEDYGVTHVLLKRDAALTTLLSRDIRYRELYWDDNFVLFLRDTAVIDDQQE
ncbi:MAG: hypothetical protein LBS54_08945 [Dysgonamonadaceae bacterium]|jgi:hypothetical protein|nr:hypothetical protein [Dysgonamonadaceae bacterium]